MRLLETSFEKFNESSFYDFSFYDFDSDKLFDEIKNDYNDLYPSNDSEGLPAFISKTHPEYQNYKDYLIDVVIKQNYEEFAENIYNIIHKGKLTLFRLITIKDKDEWIKHLQKQGQRLGIYWTWNEESAEAYWDEGKNKHDVLMSIVIDEKHVDWKETFIMNTSPQYMEEKEIRLFKNTPIKLVSLNIDGEDVDLEEYNLHNKFFKA
jgi:hypothetical protein